MTFIEAHGYVQYSEARNWPLPRIGLCEWDHRTYLDHCHVHGWVRGEVCGHHNSRMAAFDAGLLFLDQREPWMLEQWLRCPECDDPSTLMFRSPVPTFEGVRLWRHLASVAHRKAA